MFTTRLQVATAAIAAAMALTVAASPARAGRVDPPGRQNNACETRPGVDLNAVFGVQEQFITRVCTNLSPGERWRPFGVFSVWITGDGRDSVYPSGYVPLHPDPMDDFLAKLSVVKVVVDGGTPSARTYVYTAAESARTDVTLDAFEPGAPPLPMAAIIPRLHPLPAGHHTAEVFRVLSARHCDGLGAVEEENCLPAGENLIGTRHLTVAKPELT